MSIGKWFKKQMAALVIASANVETDMLHGENLEVGDDTGKFQRHLQGTLLDALIQGELTEEVKELRWRTYKILDADASVNVKILGYDEKGYPIYEKFTKNYRRALRKVPLDEYDDYELELVIYNQSQTTGKEEAHDVLGDLVTADDWQLLLQEKGFIEIGRNQRPKIEIEKYVKKLNVRRISENKVLLEFYISKYPDTYNKKTSFVIREILNAQKNPRVSDMLEIDDVTFVTYKAIGAPDFYEYKYLVESFDKIIEFDGHYVIKFIAVPEIESSSLAEQFKHDQLEELYKTKAKK